jgi:hypothetical protein
LSFPLLLLPHRLSRLARCKRHMRFH